MINNSKNKNSLLFTILFALFLVVSNCQAERLIHVFVALCDNESQGIVPVPASLGNGDDPDHNLYWGAMYGVRTWFDELPEWKRVIKYKHPSDQILERIVYLNDSNADLVYLVADAYQGYQIKSAVKDFIGAATAWNQEHIIELEQDSGLISLDNPDLIVYVGHNGLMDFSLPLGGRNPDVSVDPPQAMMLACCSRSYFKPYLEATGTEPILWTTGLCSPEAYTLSAAIEGWIRDESKSEIRQRAAEAYHQYQKCGLNAAKRLWTSE